MEKQKVLYLIIRSGVVYSQTKEKPEGNVIDRIPEEGQRPFVNTIYSEALQQWENEALKVENTEVMMQALLRVYDSPEAKAIVNKKDGIYPAPSNLFCEVKRVPFRTEDSRVESSEKVALLSFAEPKQEEVKKEVKPTTEDSTPEEIADQVSDCLMDVVKESFKQTAVNYQVNPNEKPDFEKIGSDLYDKWVLEYEGRNIMSKDLFTLAIQDIFKDYVTPLHQQLTSLKEQLSDNKILLEACESALEKERAENSKLKLTELIQKYSQ